MENPASTGEETHNEEGATATPPGNEINHYQATHSMQFQYHAMMVPYVEGPKMDWTVDDALHSRFLVRKLNVKTSLTVNLLAFKKVLNASK